MICFCQNLLQLSLGKLIVIIFVVISLTVNASWILLWRNLQMLTTLAEKCNANLAVENCGIYHETKGRIAGANAGRDFVLFICYSIHSNSLPLTGVGLNIFAALSAINFYFSIPHRCNVKLMGNKMRSNILIWFNAASVECNEKFRFFSSLSLRIQNISILVVLMFGWQINANLRRYQDLGDVYYGESEWNDNLQFLHLHQF